MGQFNDMLSQLNQIDQNGFNMTTDTYANKVGQLETQSPINPEEQDPVLKNIYNKYPALKNLGDVTLKADTSFTVDKTGAGSIEYFSPEQDTVRYGSGYNYPHPRQGTHGVVYNPNENTEQDIALDLLHGLTVDPNYNKLRTEFSNSFISRHGGDFERDWKRENEETGGDNDGKEQFKKNWIDGQIRNLLFEGTSEDFEKAKYWEGAKDVYLKDEGINKTFNNLKQYLETGENGTISGSIR